MSSIKRPKISGADRLRMSEKEVLHPYLIQTEYQLIKEETIGLTGGGTWCFGEVMMLPAGPSSLSLLRSAHSASKHW
jgi:hypothetical protein